MGTQCLLTFPLNHNWKGETMMRMSLLYWMTVFLVLVNLQPQGATGLVATGPPLNCGIFSTVNPTLLTGLSLFDQEKMLNRFIACIGANSFMDIDGLYFLYDTPGWWGRRARHKHTGLMAATSLGFNDLARTLIHYEANMNVRNVKGETALHLAALVGNNNMIGIMVDLGADVNRVDTDGNTALMAASYAGHVSTVRLLLERGANVNHRRYVGGWTALQLAINYGRTDVAALLQSWGR